METSTITTQLAEAATLMLVGMLVVFVFLTMLIVAVNGLTWLCKRVQKNKNNNQPKTESSNTTMASAGVPQAHLAAITAAIAIHQKNHS